jgi:hypothetical protein
MWGPTTLLASKTRAELGPLEPAPAYPGHSLRDGVTFRFRGGIRRAPEAGGKLGPWGNAEEAEGVAADDLPEVSWRGAEGFEEAPSVARKVKGKVTGAGRSHAGEGEIL